MTKEKLLQNFNEMSARLSQLLLEIENYISEVQSAYSNGEEYDEYFFKNINTIRMHGNHCLAELIECKASITENLTPVDRICIVTYEKEIDDALQALVKKIELEKLLGTDE